MRIEDICQIDLMRKQALNRRDALNYFNLCNEGGFEPEAKDLYELGELEHYLESSNLGKSNNSESTDKSSNKKPESKKPIRQRKSGRKRRVSTVVYRRFVDDANAMRLNPNEILKNIPEKMRILKKDLGYQKLYIGKGKKISIDSCENGRIGRVFQNTYNHACKILGR